MCVCVCVCVRVCVNAQLVVGGRHEGLVYHSDVFGDPPAAGDEMDGWVLKVAGDNTHTRAHARARARTHARTLARTHAHRYARAHLHT